VLIVDLDGTVLAENSFPRWAICLTRAHFPHLHILRRWQISCAALAMIVARKSRLITHETLKRRLQSLWQTATVGDGGAAERGFAQELAGIVRPELTPVLEAVAARRVDAVLATAAPGDYAYCLGRLLGFSDIVATRPVGATAEPDNRGDRKREAVLNLISGRGWQDRPRVLFTDHLDDVPLMRICESVYWYGPDMNRSVIEETVPGVRIHSGFRTTVPIERWAP
jgi:phosphoserine phosphatase